MCGLECTNTYFIALKVVAVKLFLHQRSLLLAAYRVYIIVNSLAVVSLHAISNCFYIKSHNVSLGTAPSPRKPQPWNFFSPPTPQTLKNLTSSARQTKSPDNSNMLHIFNNYTYTDFRTANKRILIPNYVIWVI